MGRFHRRLDLRSLAQLLRHGRYAGGQECYAGFSL